jgi:hypothetical protein
VPPVDGAAIADSRQPSISIKYIVDIGSHVAVSRPTMSCWNGPQASSTERAAAKVAVGTVIAHRPPHRSRRALLTHRAPTSGRTSGGSRRCRRHAAHIRHSDRRSDPALSPDCGGLTAVPLGWGPSLHGLRRRLPSFVRPPRRYYGPIRLLTHVHARRAACSLPEPARTRFGYG